MTALARLGAGYWNSRPISEANPGGLDGEGHVLNFPLALQDIEAGVQEAVAILTGMNAAADAALDILIADQLAAKNAAVLQLNNIVAAAILTMDGKITTAQGKVDLAEAARLAAVAAREGSEAARDLALGYRDAAQTHATTAGSNSAGHTGTSATSLTIGTGNKTLTIETGKKIVVGEWVEIAVTASPTTNAMNGKTVSYNPANGELVVAVSSVMGAGTHAAWTISVSGARGATGTGITAQTIGFLLTGGTTTPKTLTVDADASISELVAAGSYTALADGAIAAKAVMAVTAAGKLKAVVDTGFAGADSGDMAGNTIANTSPLLLIGCGAGVIAALYSRSSETYLRVGTIAGGVFTWDNEIALGYGAAATTLAGCFDTASGKLIIAYGTNASATASYVRSVALSGYIATLGTALVIPSATQAYSLSLAYHAGANKTVVVAGNGSATLAYAVTPSGTTVSVGAALNLGVVATNDPSAITTAYDVASARVCVAVVLASTISIANVNVSGTTLSAGSALTITPPTACQCAVAAYNTAISRVVLLYSANTTTSNTVWGTSLTLVSGAYTNASQHQVVASTGNGRRLGPGALTWDAGRGKHFLLYLNQTDFYAVSLGFTVSAGGAFTLETPTVVLNTTPYNTAAVLTPPGYQHQVYFAGVTATRIRAYGAAHVVTNARDWVGLAAAGAADGVSVKTVPLFTKATGLSGLTPLADYYVTKDGGLSTADTGYGKIGKALSATELLITRVAA